METVREKIKKMIESDEIFQENLFSELGFNSPKVYFMPDILNNDNLPYRSFMIPSDDGTMIMIMHDAGNTWWNIYHLIDFKEIRKNEEIRKMGIDMSDNMKKVYDELMDWNATTDGDHSLKTNILRIMGIKYDEKLHNHHGRIGFAMGKKVKK